MSRNYIATRKVFLFVAACLAFWAVVGSGMPRPAPRPKAVSVQQHIRFNHLYVVLDDSTYRHLFDNPVFWKRFGRFQEQTSTAGAASWPAKYVFGKHHYVEFLRPGGLKGRPQGDLGLGFITNRLGTLDSVRRYWNRTLDSVHVEHATTSDGANSWPWFSSVSIPHPAAQPVSAWVFENSREEMTFAGFTPQELTREIEFADYTRHVAAKMRHIPVDSVKFDRLFDGITALEVRLSRPELAYLRHTLLDIGFTEGKNRFIKNGFSIQYTARASTQSSVAAIHFTLLQSVPKEVHTFGKIRLFLQEKSAVMRFDH